MLLTWILQAEDSTDTTGGWTSAEHRATGETEKGCPAFEVKGETWSTDLQAVGKFNSGSLTLLKSGAFSISGLEMLQNPACGGPH